MPIRFAYRQHNLARQVQRAAVGIGLVSCCGWCWTAIRVMAAFVALVAVAGLAYQVTRGHVLDHITMAALVGSLVVVFLQPAALRAEFNSGARRVAHQVAVGQAAELEPIREAANNAFEMIGVAAVQAATAAANAGDMCRERAHTITARMRAVIGAGAPDLVLHPRFAASLVANQAALKAA